MNKHRTLTILSAGKRCGHPWCSDCKKRHGSNRGNRRIRQAVKQKLKKWMED